MRMRAIGGQSVTDAPPGTLARSASFFRRSGCDISCLSSPAGWLRIGRRRIWRREPSMPLDKKTTSFNLGYVLLAALGVMLLQNWWSQSQAVQTLPYSEFQKLVREDKVVRVVVSQDDVQGELKEPLNGKT